MAKQFDLHSMSGSIWPVALLGGEGQRLYMGASEWAQFWDQIHSPSALPKLLILLEWMEPTFLYHIRW